MQHLLPSFNSKRRQTQILGQLLSAKELVRRQLYSLQQAITRCLRPCRCTKTPFFRCIRRDVDPEVAELIKQLATINMYSSTIKETRATWTLVITKVEKLAALLNIMNQLVSRGSLLTKSIGAGRAAVLATARRPVTFKYYKTQWGEGRVHGISTGSEGGPTNLTIGYRGLAQRTLGKFSRR